MSTLVANPDDRFSHDKAHLTFYLPSGLLFLAHLWHKTSFTTGKRLCRIFLSHECLFPKILKKRSQCRQKKYPSLCIFVGQENYTLGSEYKHLILVWGADRKFHPKGHCLASRGYAKWCKTVILRDGIFYPHRTLKFDFFFLCTFQFWMFYFKRTVTFITTHNDNGVRHF